MSATAATSAAAILLVGMLLAGCGDDGSGLPAGDSGPTAIEVGNRAFDTGLYNTAMNAYAIARESMPERSEPVYNSANTLYRQERYREAIEMYDQLMSRDALDQSDWTAFNSGNSLYSAGEYEQAIEMYKQALRENPDDLDAKHNLELALAHLPQDPPEEEPQQEQPQEQQQEQQEQPQEPPPQEPQQNQGDQQGDQQQDDAEGEPQESDERDDQAETEGEPGEQSEQEGEQSAASQTPPERLTEDEAMQLLEAVGESAEPLQNAIQRRRPGSGLTNEPQW